MLDFVYPPVNHRCYVILDKSHGIRPNLLLVLFLEVSNDLLALLNLLFQLLLQLDSLSFLNVFIIGRKPF